MELLKEDFATGSSLLSIYSILVQRNPRLADKRVPKWCLSSVPTLGLATFKTGCLLHFPQLHIKKYCVIICCDNPDIIPRAIAFFSPKS